MPGSGINTHQRDSWREEHPHQEQEGQRGTRRATRNTGWQTGLQAQKQQIVIRRKWEKCCQEREAPIFYPLLDEVGWTEAAARTIGAGHQGNPCRATNKLAGDKADSVTVGSSPAALSVSGQSRGS